jgi:hypothetical protein
MARTILVVKVPKEKPKTLPQYLAIIEQKQKKAKQSLWYRGCGQSFHPLLPSLYRHKKAKTPEELATLERQLIARFKQKSLPYLTRSLTDEWDTLFFMQHYGVPTRLLDWTENPLIALHFALMRAPYKVRGDRRIKYTADATVWVLDPAQWNRHALKHQSFDGGPLTPGDEPLQAYKPTPTFAKMNNHPVALYGAHNSPRIVAQQGVFTIFGQNTAPMEQVYIEESFPSESLAQIVLSRSVINKMRESLLNHGVTESVVFPDLEGLSRELKRSFNFEV